MSTSIEGAAATWRGWAAQGATAKETTAAAKALVPTEFSQKYVAHAIRAYQTAARLGGVG